MQPIIFIDIEEFKEIQEGFNSILNQLEEFNKNAKNRLEAMRKSGYTEKEIGNIINILYGDLE